LLVISATVRGLSNLTPSNSPRRNRNQELGEPVVVGRRGHQAAAARQAVGLPVADLAERVVPDRLSRPRLRHVQCREILALGAERCVVHAERGEDPLSEELIKLLPGHDFDQPAEHVRRDRIVPFAARLEHQWQLRPSLDARREIKSWRRAPFEPGRAVHLVDGMCMVEPVGQARGMGE
jgi:hypothetical protein